MHDTISTTTQRKLIFVPVLNIFVPFIWLHNCRLNYVRPRDLSIGTLCAFFSLLPFGLAQFICAKYWKDFAGVFTCFMIYFAPMLLGYVLIRHQEYLERRELSKEYHPVMLSGRKKFWVICIAVLVALAIVISAAVLIVQDFKGKNIPDQNGPDDYSLAVLTMDDLTSEKTRSVIIGKRMFTTGARTDAYKIYPDYDRDYLDISTRSMSGVRTIHATKTDSNQLTLSIESSLKEGNAALVVLVDGAYHCNVSINTADSITIRNVSGKLVEVRLAGESAKIEVTISRSFQEVANRPLVP